MPVHAAGEAVRVWPTRGVPVIVGSESGAGGLPGSTTGPAAAEVADMNPTSFVAVSRTRMVRPMSAGPSR